MRENMGPSLPDNPKWERPSEGGPLITLVSANSGEEALAS